jgi:predicted deacylase
MPIFCSKPRHLFLALPLLIGSAIALANSEVAAGTDTASTPDTSVKAKKAKNIELDKPVEKILDLPAPEHSEVLAEEEEVVEENRFPDGSPFTLLGTEVGPGTATRLAWSASESFEEIAGSTPILVINGREPGPVMCLTAAIHGDELNGIEIIRRVMYNIKPENLVGTIIGVPIVNMQGFRRSSRYLTDRRDLNRYFPGNPEGSSASRIAHSFFTEIISHCGALVDLHTGSFHRTNLPQLRADLINPEVMRLSQSFGATVVLHSDPAKGTLRQAATDAGIPTVTLEAGGPMQLQDKEVAHGVKGIETLLNTLGMVKRKSFWGKPAPVFYQSTWVRADQGGILFSEVYLGKRVRRGDLLGTVTDPVTNQRTDIVSPENGRILGMAINQVVMPGFAAFRIGMQKPETELDQEGQTPPEDHDVSSLNSKKQPLAKSDRPGAEEEVSSE